MKQIDEEEDKNCLNIFDYNPYVLVKIYDYI